MIQFAVRWILEFTYQNRLFRVAILALIYTATLIICLLTAYQIRFDFDVPPIFEAPFTLIAIVAIGTKLLALLVFQQFDRLLTYFGKPDLKRLFTACMIGSLPIAGMSAARNFAFTPPLGVVLIDLVLCVVALSTVRLSFRHLRAFALRTHLTDAARPRRLGILGAGDAGALLARHVMEEPSLALQLVAFFDDDWKRYSSVHGIPVVGKPEQIAEFKTKLQIEELIIAMPSASAKRIHQMLELARAAGLECRTVPSLGQLATGRVSISALRPVRIEDLLGRVPVRMKTHAIRDLLKGRTVMVTGAGGSIGGELCRQILSFQPAVLLLIERSEPHVFAIEQELVASYPDTSIMALVVDVTSAVRMRTIFSRFRPQAIFHAAAHKHVPMMEHQPAEAVRNNVFGTALVAEMAIEHGVERFIFISTDKAVNPSSVMGATKRCAEIYLQSLTTRSGATKFMAVRFGNVLGSSGSVVPTFAKQIAAGGPVTVTHPEVSRFFITIPEAVLLVLEASAIGDGGDIFMLDMGKPIKIVDLAKQMILLSGLKPYEDIDIAFSGLRPGEKLEEVLSYSREHVMPTEHPQITRLVAPLQPYSDVRSLFGPLSAAVEDPDCSPARVKALLAKAVPQYTSFVVNAAESSGNGARPSVNRELAGVRPASGARGRK
jgi:FlaA1/EpsC-like NDP-sugar epimerase